EALLFPWPSRRRRASRAMVEPKTPESKKSVPVFCANHTQTPKTGRLGKCTFRDTRTKTVEFITIHGLCYTVSPMKGGTHNGWLTVHCCAVPPHGVSGFDELDARRVSAPRLAL